MTLYYEPKTIDYGLEAYDKDGKHYVRGHLLGTKVGDNGWSVSKKTFLERIKQFKGFPFIVSPKELDPTNHFLVGTDYEDQLKKQAVVTKGIITELFGPFSYNDGSDDIYMDAEFEITDPEISKAMRIGKLPWNTSPYIWPVDSEGKPIPISQIKRKTDIEDWIPVHDALVDNPAFGTISKISKQCFGPKGQCHQALAGSSHRVAEILSSQLDSIKPSNVTMENNEGQKTIDSNVEKPIQVQFSAAPVANVPNTEDKEEKVNPEMEALKLELETQKKSNSKLLLRLKHEDLSKIFTGNFESEDSKKATFKKYEDMDTERLLEFHADVLKYGVPKKILKENALAGSSDNQKETFPLTGSSEKMTQKQASLIELLGGRA